ncbi:MAG: AAA family ATPase [Chloroflexi bacterium]|nr:AAA family ATPase [Chloroflexota bacterium]
MAHEDASPDAAPQDHAPAETSPAGSPSAGLGRITRVRLKNYKSIVSCDVELQPLTILVGPNGSGKSNFLDALAFVSEALTLGLDQAIRNRGNLDRILSAARPPGEDSFSIELHFQLSSGELGQYRFEVVAESDGGPRVRRERLELRRTHLEVMPYWELDRDHHSALWTSGEIYGLKRIPIDGLFLVILASLDAPRPSFDLLSSMEFYNPLPDQMRAPVEQSAEPHLLPDGRNLASMLRRMQTADPDQVWGITQYMKRVLPGLEEIRSTAFQGFDYLSFSVQSGDDGSTTESVASQMSDGTLRGLAVLVALFQGRMGGKSGTSLVGLEEPENNLHPATGGAFADALADASHDGQVLVTTHSAALLDGEDIAPTSVLVVAAENGKTRIGPIDEVSRSILREHLLTVGELLEQGQLFPEPTADGEAAGTSTSDPVPVGR